MIIIINYGSKYTNDIQEIINKYTRVKIINYIKDFDECIDKIIQINPSKIILSGGPSHLYLQDSPKISKALFDCDIPILGICYGMQLINYVNGGTITRMDNYKENKEIINLLQDNELFNNIDNHLEAEMRHYDTIQTLAQDYITIAETSYCIAAIKHKTKKIYGVQFHPEITKTNMNLVLYNFINL